MASVMSAITNTVPITQFNRGLAGKIFDEVKQCGAKVVMKNNTAECVLISPDEYVRLMDELNDARLLAVASERMAHFDPSTLISEEEMNRRLGVTDDDLAGFDAAVRFPRRARRHLGFGAARGLQFRAGVCVRPAAFVRDGAVAPCAVAPRADARFVFGQIAARRIVFGFHGGRPRSLPLRVFRGQFNFLFALPSFVPHEARRFPGLSV